jgi:hypothetical protein
VKKIRNIFRCLLLLTISFTARSQVKDTLYFNNGDLLIGELKSISLGRVKFDDDNMDVLNIKVTQIRTIKATTHIYRLETINGESYYTSLETAIDGRVKVIIEGITQEIPVEDIRNLVPLKGKTEALWQGNMSMGYSYAKSTGIGQLNSSLSVEYLTRKFDILIGGSTIINQTDTAIHVDNATAGITNSYLFTPVWEVNVFLIYQRNLEQGLSRRYQEGGGGGCNFLSTTHTRIKAITGVVFSQELSIEGVQSPTQVDIPIIVNFNFFRFHRPDLTINMREDLFFGVTNKGRIRQDGQFNITWKIFGDFSFNLQFYHNYDNQPPGENSEKLDYGVVFGVSYKFSQ